MHTKDENRNDTLRKPTILFDKRVFPMLIETKGNIKFRTRLYKNLDNKLGPAKQSHHTYRTWFSDPLRIPSNKEQEFYNLLADGLITTLIEQNRFIDSETKKIIEEYKAEMKNRLLH